MSHALLLVLCLTAGAEPANLLRDGSFEAPFLDNGLPAGWWPFQSEGGVYTRSRVAAGRNGGQALRVEGNGEYGGVVSVPIDLDPARSYLVEGWVRLQTGDRATIKLDYASADRYLGSSYGGYATAGDDGWVVIRLQDERRRFPEATRLSLALALEGTGAALFDDVRLLAVDRLPGDAVNALANGQCESGARLAPLHYTLYHPPGQTPVAAWTADAAHSGRFGLRLSGAGEYAVWGHEYLPLDRTKVYLLTGWIRYTGGQAQIKFDFRSDEAWLGQQPSDIPPGDGQWHKVSVTADPAAFPTATGLAAACVIGAGARADFDELVLEIRPR